MPSPNSKLVSVGSHNVSKCPPTNLVEYQWDINNHGQITYTSGQLIKMTYRHAPKGQTLESVFMDYRVVNNSGVPVSVLPLWSSIRELRVYINNKKTIDFNREEQCRLSWLNKLLTSHDTDGARDNDWFVKTGVPTVLDGANLLNPVVIAAGDSHQFHLNFEDWSDMFSGSMPLHRVGLIEVEFNLSSRADFVCSPQAELGNLQIEDLTVYSRHKEHLQPPPSSMASYTMFHRDYDIFQLAPSQHPFDTAPAGTEFDINISTEFPKRTLISRILVYARDPASPDAYRQIDSSFISKIELLRGGLTFLGTDNHYDTERKIFKEISNWLKRHHSTAWPTKPSDVNHGDSFPAMFVDCSTVQHNLNTQASADMKHVEVNGTSNLNNLVLRLTSNGGVTSATANLVTVVEYYRFDRLHANGAVQPVLEQHP